MDGEAERRKASTALPEALNVVASLVMPSPGISAYPTQLPPCSASCQPPLLRRSFAPCVQIFHLYIPSQTVSTHSKALHRHTRCVLQVLVISHNLTSAK